MLPQDNEKKIQAALDAVVQSGLTANGYPVYSLRSAAQQFSVPYTTLHARWKGRKTRKEVAEEQQILTPAEEKMVVQWTKAMALRGMGWSPEIIRNAARMISGKPVGHKYTLQLRKRHPDLKFIRTRGLEACRARSLNKPQVMKFFDILDDIYGRLQVTPDRIYNMDEKGVQLGVGGRRGVLIDAAQKVAYHIEDGCRDIVTCIECVCADGTAVPTMHIFKAQNFDLEWGRDNPLNARCVHMFVWNAC